MKAESSSRLSALQRRLLLIPALYLPFALLITWPLLLHFNRAIIGDAESDVWKHLWGFWWMRRCLVEQHVLPLYTHLLNYPYGGSLFFIDPVGGLMSVPLLAVLTPAEGYNALALFNVVLACCGAFWLARYYTKSTPAAFVAGVIYGCSPYLISNLTSGISESFNIGWIPLFILYFTRALREPGTRNAVMAGILLAVATVGCWYYGAFCLVYAVSFFVYHLAARVRAQRLLPSWREVWTALSRTRATARVPLARKHVRRSIGAPRRGLAWKRLRETAVGHGRRYAVAAMPCGAIALCLQYAIAPAQPWPRAIQTWAGITVVLVCIPLLYDAARGAWTMLERASTDVAAHPWRAFTVDFCRTTMKRVFIVAAVSGAIILPAAYLFRMTLNNDFSIVFRQRSPNNIDMHLSERFHNISHLIDYVTPGKSAAVVTCTVDRLTRVSYVGYIALLLATLGALTVRRRDVRWWGGVAIVSIVLSLGPFLYITPQVHLNWHFPPYMWLYDWFPFFSQISIPFRFEVLVLLALGVLTSYLLSGWMRAHSRLWRVLLSTSFSLAIVFETMAVSPAPFPMPLASIEAPPIFSALGEDKEDCGLVDVPVQRFEGELLPGEYFYYQMLHHKAIPNRVEGNIPLYVYKNRFLYHLFFLEHDWSGYPDESERALRDGVREMRDFRLKYIVVHENLLRPGAAGRVHALLGYFLGPPRKYAPDVSVYQVYGNDARGGVVAR